MEKAPPHVLIFPFPLLGHINSMLRLADLLCLAGIHVTFLNTDHTHHRLLRSNPNLLAGRPGLRFRTISDGLPVDESRRPARFTDLFFSLRSATKPLLRAMLAGSGGRPGSDDTVTCIVVDGLLTFAIDVADELGIPIFIFRTASPCSFWTFFCGPALAAGGELPFEEDDMDRPIRGVPGMEAFLRRRDLPSFFRVKQLSDVHLQLILTATQDTTRASRFILNAFEDIDGPILSHIRAHCPTTYAIGPLHAHLQSRLTESNDSPPTDFTPSSISFLTEDRSCMTWLDSQPHKSVLYISFGSIAAATGDQLLEFWHGVVNSQTRFLWVMRPDIVDGMGQMPAELTEATDERGRLVGWAPQVDVLAHTAVGGFLTHSGWNSTLESVSAGVPMICWPFFADQHINSRYVEGVWKVGLDMKDRCDRRTVEMMIRELMEGKREELVKSTARIADLAKRSVSQGGSSYMSFEKLVKDIRSINSGPHPDGGK
ncbi:7-deoxyloganetic acid glucosyl transferase-like [Magnolia sinica]|uniref:7-deoxyloganetic acid glucosyl transferase-like n=1 Tax=Magnolia sinica TaxID=86752 RepID=UPI002657F069|nr:7-deoxyloganetic acid glucosyl transferase-like [Magnolia sinica]